MSSGPAVLLTALLDACRLGHVCHHEAAKLLCIRKEDVGDLVAWRMIEVAIWRVYQSAFNHAFPECNPALYRQPTHLDPPQAKRWPMPTECRHYTASQSEQLPASQPRLNDPISNAAYDFAEPRNAEA